MTMPSLRSTIMPFMALAAVAYAKAMRGRRIMIATSSVGPGSTNMVTAAAVAHANRLPLLLISGSEARAKKSRVQYIRSVCGSNNDNTLIGLKTVHFNQ